MERAEVFRHVLTGIHGVGSIVVLGMAAYVAATGRPEDLATTPGGRQIVAAFGDRLWLFFLPLGAFLAALAYGSHTQRAWSWPAALVAYSIGVVGSLIELAFGYWNYLASLAVNGAVVALLLSKPVRAEWRAQRARSPVD